VKIEEEPADQAKNKAKEEREEKIASVW